MRSNYTVHASTQFAVLSPDQLECIHFATLEVLERTGVNIYEPEALELLRRAGAYVRDGRVYIPSPLVEWALRTAPSRVVLCDRNGNARLFLEGHNFYFGPGPTNNFTRDPITGERRKPRKEDTANVARICDALPNIDFVMDLGTPQDVLPQVADIHAFEALLLNTTKPIVHWAFDTQGYAVIVEMCIAVAGSLEELQRRPFVCLYSEPSSPLKHSGEAVAKLLFMAEKNLPAVYTPCVMAGATAPATMAGTLVMANAECLAGLVMSQLKREGAPFIMGGVVSIMDMSSTILSYGAPELSLLQAGLTEMAHYYGLPVFGTAGCTDSKLVDQQAAIEAAISILISAQSGANLIHDVGYTEFGSTGSIEQLIMCDEIIGMVKRIIRGIEVTPETLAVDVIHNVGPGGHFLAEEHTLEHFRSQMWFPRLINRCKYDEWAKAGRQSLGDRVRARAAQLLKEYTVEPLPDETRRKIRAILEKAESSVRYGS